MSAQLIDFLGSGAQKFEVILYKGMIRADYDEPCNEEDVEDYIYNLMR